MNTLDAATSRNTATLDSVGNPLPDDFGSLAETYAYTGSDLTSIVRAKGGATWTKTLTYSGGNLTASSAWVRS